ncbi:MAG: DUF2332 domain-containing protein [Propionibacteriaceae bacterium]|nr:DUF2332 domain-containing protein [Propionibacteriaceae bacterium]
MKGSRFLTTAPIDELYNWFADETAATSPTWERLCRWIADTPELHPRLDALPGQTRQPNRLLAAIRFLDGPTEPGSPFLTWLDQRWTDVEHVILTRTTQTNEPGRCAVIAPVLASLPQPVALLELGSSAGLCLLPDHYAYRYDDQPTPATDTDAGSGPSIAADSGPAKVTRPTAAALGAPEFPCHVTGLAPGDPADLRVAARLGLDLNPLDPTDPGTRRWLRALIWPGEEDREERLAQALELASASPPPLRQADLTADPAATITAALSDLRALTPDATPVITHSAFLAYLSRDDRQAVVDATQASGARWISFEGPGVVPGIDATPPDPIPANATFAVSLDGDPLGWAQAHGRSVHWRSRTA